MREENVSKLFEMDCEKKSSVIHASWHNMAVVL